MNSRLIGLYAALQGGTRRKPSYRNTGALVSWVYAIKLKDQMGVDFSTSEQAIADTTFETSNQEVTSVAFSVTGIELLDMLKTLESSEVLNLSYSISAVSLQDVVKTTNNSTFEEKFSMAASITGISLTDNVKVAETSKETLSVGFSITQIALEAV